MNNEAGKMVTRMGIEAGRGWVSMQREIGRVEVEKSIARLKCGICGGSLLHSGR